MSPADLAALRVQVAGDGGYFAAKCRALLALHDTMHETLTATQARCTELLLEVRQLRAGIVLPGFTCACGVFTGFEKEAHVCCRACGAPRST